LILSVRDDLAVQGRTEDQRDLFHVESVAGHLLRPGRVFAFLAEHRRELFADELFADLFPSGRCRPSVPADVMACVITLKAVHGLSDAAGHAFVQNLRRGHYELVADEPDRDRVRVAFGELARCL
jgi:hypothetical protein